MSTKVSSPTEEQSGSIWGPLMIVPMIGVSAFLLCTATPYLINVDCSRSGYAPVSLTSCLPESEIAATNWEVTIPIDGIEYYITRDQPLIQAMPSIILYLTLFGSGVVVLAVIFSGVIRWAGQPSHPSSRQRAVDSHRQVQPQPIQEKAYVDRT